MLITFVDTETQELVIGLDSILLTLGIYLDEGDIEDILGEDLPLRLVFSKFIPEHHVRPSSQGQIDGWIMQVNYERYS